MNHFTDLVQAGAMEALDLVVAHAPGIAWYSIRAAAVGSLILGVGAVGVAVSRLRAAR